LYYSPYLNVNPIKKKNPDRTRKRFHKLDFKAVYKIATRLVYNIVVK